MATLTGFNAAEHDGMSDFSPIPNGTYTMIIVDSEKPEEKKYYKLTFEIVEGEYQGRNHWLYLNLMHDKEQVRKIANDELADICRAVGVLEPSDTSDLHNIPLKVTLKVTPAKGTYGPGNKATKYESCRAGGQQARASKEAEAKNPVTPSTPPWQRG